MSRPDPAPARPTILLVDDNPDKLLALESILLALDVDIVMAQSGREALRRLLERDVAVILLDVRMPGMDGFETAALIRQRERSAHTPIIFVTAFSEEMQVARGYSLGAVDYILAPIVPEILRTKVSVLVELFRATEEVRRQAESLRRRTRQLHQLALASLAINSAESIDAMVAISTTSALDILEAQLAETTAAVDQHSTHYVSGPGRSAAPLGAAPSPVGPEVRRTNRTLRTSWDHDGGRRHALGVPLVGRDGGNIGVVEVSRTTDRPFDQEDEDLLVQLAQTTSIALENAVFSEAREANRLKDEFIAAVSHELRTPLNALRSWAWVLRRKDLPAEKIGPVAEAIERSVVAQTRLVDDLLDVSRIMAGKMSLRFDPVDLGAVVVAAIDALAPSADGQGIHVVRALEGGPFSVSGDADRLQQIVVNLLSNAIKFTPADGRVEIALTRSDADVVLRVTDTGCGIVPGFLPHVFERFRQADGGSTRRAGGLGVGLAIARQLVEMHGGRITAQSEGEGRGATFAVSLPLVAALQPHAAPAGTGELPASLEGAHILLVEDDVETRQVMRVVLAGTGARVVAVGTAEEGASQLTTAPFDVVLCDIGLPGEDGYSFIRRARAMNETTRRMPALALSAFARDRDRLRAREAGFDGHIAKPVDPGELIRVLSTLLAYRANGVGVAGPDSDGTAGDVPATAARIA
jgi:signal transduction histidine kinase/DNA-binding response OmpR family regulator